MLMGEEVCLRCTVVKVQNYPVLCGLGISVQVGCCLDGKRIDQMLVQVNVQNVLALCHRQSSSRLVQDFGQETEKNSCSAELPKGTPSLS